MKIGEMPQRAGVSQKAVPRYDEPGLPAPPRMRGGYRDFTEQDVRFAPELGSLSELGITAERTRLLLECLASGTADGDECRSSLAECVAAAAGAGGNATVPAHDPCRARRSDRIRLPFHPQTRSVISGSSSPGCATTDLSRHEFNAPGTV
jgi:DNA-binding transcriptional MerR regulator